MFVTACLVAIAAGLLNPVQSGLTGTLQQSFGRPFIVVAASLAFSLALALIGVALECGSDGMAEAASRAPWWSWLAGMAGLAILVARPASVPQFGASAFTGLTVTAAVIGFLVLDQMGWLGFEPYSIGSTPIAGAALMVDGAALVCAF